MTVQVGEITKRILQKRTIAEQELARKQAEEREARAREAAERARLDRLARAAKAEYRPSAPSVAYSVWCLSIDALRCLWLPCSLRLMLTPRTCACDMVTGRRIVQ